MQCMRQLCESLNFLKSQSLAYLAKLSEFRKGPNSGANGNGVSANPCSSAALQATMGMVVTYLRLLSHLHEPGSDRCIGE